MGRTHCPIIIMHVSQKKRGVTPKFSYTYVGLPYVNIVVAKNGHRSDFKINMVIISIVPYPPPRHFRDPLLHLSSRCLRTQTYNNNELLLLNTAVQSCAQTIQYGPSYCPDPAKRAAMLPSKWVVVHSIVKTWYRSRNCQGSWSTSCRDQCTPYQR